jgi:hypothetical protein
MAAGIVCLTPVYKLVRACPDGYDFGDRPRIPIFRQTALEILAPVPERQGVYLWGKYDHRRYWRSIYFGLAGFGKTACLHARLLEEIMDERSCFWRVCRSADHLVRAREDGQNARKRAIRKEGATHIIWVATPSLENRQVRKVEADLIEALNPTANLLRPKPPADVQRQAGLIYAAFRKKIHAHRDDACPVRLK